MSTSATLEDRVAALERQLAALQPADALQVNPLLVNPDGSLSALFTGGITTPAGGYILESFPSSNQASGHRWISPVQGVQTLVADIEGYSVKPPVGQPSPLILRLGANPSTPARAAELKLTGGLAAGVGGNKIQALVAALTRRLLDDNGNSDWIQAAFGVTTGNVQQAALDYGTAVLTWAGSTLSGTVTVAHNVGRVPIAAVACSWGAPGPTTIPLCNIYAPSSTNFNLNASTQVAWSGTVSVAWVAIG